MGCHFGRGLEEDLNVETGGVGGGVLMLIPLR